MSDDPFLIEGPALINVSGGRTSAYLLWRMLQSRGGVLPADVIPVFANTGKEMPQTLTFLQDIADRWTPIRWLEWRAGNTFAEVDYATAARNGEPFAALIRQRKMLPYSVGRFCTEQPKIRTMQRFAASLGWTDRVAVLGLRADEAHRVARVHARNSLEKDGHHCVMPLHAAGITRRDVHAFWRAQNFDLLLPSIDGRTPLGNCDLCFLKNTRTLARIIAENPAAADWWIEQEDAIGATFRHKHRPLPSYRELRDAVLNQGSLPLGDDSTTECFCHD